MISSASFGLDQGDKVALVGINGSGKTTLLRILSGAEKPDAGEVRMNNSISVSFLTQNPEFVLEQSIIDAILEGDSPELQLVKSYYKNLASGKESIEDLINEMDRLNTWDFETSINQVLGKLGIHNSNQNVQTLSGGMKKRVALAKALLDDPDFLIMDEPTNHLDLEAIEWLENYLSGKKTTLLLVSHDRYFLDRICNSVIEIDEGNIFKHQGNYVSYLSNKEERKAQKEKEADKAQNLLRKELEWLRRQPKARGTKAKYRIEAVYELQGKASNRSSNTEVDFSIGKRRLGKKILELKHINKSYSGEILLNDFNYTFKAGEKIGIVGKNGTGKSTLLNIITQVVQPDSGKVELGQNTVFGYYKQEEFPFSESIKVIEVVTQVAETISTSKGIISASQLLNRFSFPPKQQHEVVGKLSGGEKKRLQLLRVLMKNPNFLILDEPTNDLDIVTLNILEEFLSDFRGCLLLVSHDRYFMDRLTDHLFVFQGNGLIRDFPGNYSDFRQFQKEEKEKSAKIAKVEKSETPLKPRHNQKRKLTYKEKQESELLENQIEKLEEEKSRLTNLLNSGETDHEKLFAWGKELEVVNENLGAKELRWLELSEIEE